ncbi:MAG: MurR/RpiR family transcriptional regulator [Atopobiaceae bacterium]|nr:MurR/RpiR family transcriptional regulator [Atopobiaceae bacterium]
MIYDKLSVGLLGLLATEEADATDAQIARYVLAHAAELDDLSVKELAAACHVGTGSVSRFAREAGFGGFAELRDAFAEASRKFERLEGASTDERGHALALRIASSIKRAAATVDGAALTRLVADLASYDKVYAFGFLKAQAAALDLQVDLLMQGKYIGTCASPSDQIDHIARARSDELVVVFSYTGSYFDARDLRESLARRDRPKIWMVCGSGRPLPPFVADRLLFSSDQSRFGHPYQLEYVAGLITQEYAAIQ